MARGAGSAAAAVDGRIGGKAPSVAFDGAGEGGRARLAGCWTVEHAPAVEREITRLTASLKGTTRAVFDLSGVERLDTLGAWVLDRTRHEFGEQGRAALFVGASPEHDILLNEVAYRGFQPEPVKRASRLMDVVVDIGSAVAGAGRDLARGVSFLGEIVAALLRVIIHPRRFRFAALTNQLEQIAFKGVPIVVLISFLVGCIVSQQGLFQLQRFGAQAFVVNLIGVLTLRELGVLLTSIMVAGRSGSAFTAEIGSMRMREEVDALRVMGVDPLEALIVPRVLALVIGLPLLAFLASMAALFGGGLVSWFYGDIAPDVFLTRLKASIGFSTFMVGMIKAPFMALVIGVIASIEGMAVEGSAESLGRHVTSSVVKSIFMVIVLDGFFAIFFAAIRY